MWNRIHRCHKIFKHLNIKRFHRTPLSSQNKKNPIYLHYQIDSYILLLLTSKFKHFLYCFRDCPLMKKRGGNGELGSADTLFVCLSLLTNSFFYQWSIIRQNSNLLLTLFMMENVLNKYFILIRRLRSSYLFFWYFLN